MKVALIGCGRISQVAHLPALAKVDELELVAAIDPSEALAAGVAREWDARPFTDLATCLREARPDVSSAGSA